MTTALCTGSAYRGRNDDVSLNSSTFTYSQNTDWEQNVDVNFRVRFECEETNNKSFILAWQLEYSTDGSNYYSVTTSSNVCKAVSSSQFSDLDATTNVLTVSAQTFTAGEGSTDGVGTSLQMQNQQSEYEFCVQLVGADLNDNDTVYLRIAGLSNYTSGNPIATLTVNKASTGTSSSKSAFLRGGQDTSSIKHAYMEGESGAPAGVPASSLVYIHSWSQGLLDGAIGNEGIVGLVEGSGMSIVAGDWRTSPYMIKGVGDYGETDLLWSISGAPTTIQGSFYWKYHTVPNVEISILRVYRSSGSTARINFNPSTQKIYGRYVSDGTEVNLVLSADTWYEICFKVDVGTATSKLWYDVKPMDGSWTGEQYTEYAQTASYLDGYLIGFIESNSYTITSGEAYWGGLIMNYDLSDYPMGDFDIKQLSPESDATHNNTGGYIKDNGGNTIDGSSYYAYSWLDEVPWTSALGDYIYQTSVATGDYVAINFEDISSATIWDAKAVLKYQSSGTSSNNGKCYIEGDTEDTVYSGDMSETTSQYRSAILTRPSGGWTQTKVNALTGRMGYSSNVATQPRWASLMLEVVVTPEAGATASDSKHAYIKGSANTSDSKHAYLLGGNAASSIKHAYLSGEVAGGTASDSKSAFILGIGDLLVPDSDGSGVGSFWMNENNSTSNLYLSIDESIPSDIDFIWDGSPANNNYKEFPLSDPGGTVAGGSVVILWRGRDKTGSGHVSVKAELRQGASTSIASDTVLLTATPRVFYLQLTQGERDSITDWTDLRLRFTEVIT